MGMFTLDVAGRAVACIRAATTDEARQTLDDPWFRHGLLGMGGEGRPVWNGEGEVCVRRATDKELALIAEQASTNGEQSVFPFPGENNGSSSEHRYILASRVEHTPVFNPAGARMGHIADLSIERRSGQVAYAIMSFGGFLGIGKRFHPLPWTMLTYDPAQAGYLVPLDRAALENAPHYDAEELRRLGGSGQEAYAGYINAYYGSYGYVSPL